MKYHKDLIITWRINLCHLTYMAHISIHCSNGLAWSTAFQPCKTCGGSENKNWQNIISSLKNSPTFLKFQWSETRKSHFKSKFSRHLINWLIFSESQRCQLSVGISIIWSTKTISYDSNTICQIISVKLISVKLWCTLVFAFLSKTYFKKPKKMVFLHIPEILANLRKHT